MTSNTYRIPSPCLFEEGYQEQNSFKQSQKNSDWSRDKKYWRSSEILICLEHFLCKMAFQIFTKFNTVALICLVCLANIQKIRAYPPSEWIQGYFGIPGDCLPWDSSWKTCSDSTSWDSWEDYMFVNPLTNVWDHCPDGEYFDQLSSSCQSWGGACTGSCLYQTSCLECPAGKIFDAETFTWVDNWDTTQLHISSPQVFQGQICRNPDIYVDPFSSQELELGTLEYPFRTFKAASSEILNHYSHSEVDISIFVKDGYIQLETFYFLNMSSVSIHRHPEYLAADRRAYLIFDRNIQAGISAKARFHILANTDTMPDDIISNGNFLESELGELSKPNFGFMLARTNLEINGIDIYSTQIEYLIVPIYLQSKGVSLCK